MQANNEETRKMLHFSRLLLHISHEKLAKNRTNV